MQRTAQSLSSPGGLNTTRPSTIFTRLQAESDLGEAKLSEKNDGGISTDGSFAENIVAGAMTMVSDEPPADEPEPRRQLSSEAKSADMMMVRERECER